MWTEVNMNKKQKTKYIFGLLRWDRDRFPAALQWHGYTSSYILINLNIYYFLPFSYRKKKTIWKLLSSIIISIYGAIRPFFQLIYTYLVYRKNKKKKLWTKARWFANGISISEVSFIWHWLLIHFILTGWKNGSTRKCAILNGNCSIDSAQIVC